MNRLAVPAWYPALGVIAGILLAWESLTTYITHNAAQVNGGEILLVLPSYGWFEVLLAAFGVGFAICYAVASIGEEAEAPESVPVP